MPWFPDHCSRVSSVKHVLSSEEFISSQILLLTYLEVPLEQFFNHVKNHGLYHLLLSLIPTPYLLPSISHLVPLGVISTFFSTPLLSLVAIFFLSPFSVSDMSPVLEISLLYLGLHSSLQPGLALNWGAHITNGSLVILTVFPLSIGLLLSQLVHISSLLLWTFNPQALALHPLMTLLLISVRKYSPFYVCV